MMGRQTADQAQLFYSFNLDERIPKTHLLRRIDVFVTEALAGIHSELAGCYSHTGWPSIDPELLMRMLIVGYCYGIRSERRLCEEVALNLAYRWFCRLDLEDEVPIIRASPRTGMAGFATAISCDLCSSVSLGFALRQAWSRATGSRSTRASSKRMQAVIMAASEEIDWSSLESPSRAVREYLDALDEAEEVEVGRQTPKVVCYPTRHQPGRPRRTSASSLATA